LDRDKEVLNAALRETIRPIDKEKSMATVKSFAVGVGDMFYIRHGSDSFTVIDCDLGEDNAEEIIADVKSASAGKGIFRFICTHPDEDHFGGLHVLDDAHPIANFYCVKNQATKDEDTESFKRYCTLRDGSKAFFLQKGCTRKWLNQSDDERKGAGIHCLWPDISNSHFKEALASCDAGESYNNTSAVIRYRASDWISFMWLGDLETQFMEDIVDSIELEPTTVVFAAHHGRSSGKIPDSWLEQIKPKVIVLGEAPSRHLHYYTGYETLTQNSAGHITLVTEGANLHVYVSSEDYECTWLDNLALENLNDARYLGTLATEA
jgi:beta-lactamase superfamily II metal-dependent hydrolase